MAQALAGQYGEDLITEVHCGGTTTVFRCANLRRVCCVLQSARRRAIIHRSLLWSSRSCRGADDIVGQLASLEGRGLSGINLIPSVHRQYEMCREFAAEVIVRMH